MQKILYGVLAFLALHGISEACTGLKLTAKDGKTVHGRTLEFGIDVKPSLAFVPQGYSFTSTTPNGNGLAYKSKYAAIGAFCFDQLLLMDGINEKGLSIGVFYFPGFAGYTPTTKENQSHSLSPIDFSNWILTQFATLDEVKDGIKNVMIAPTVANSWGPTPPPFHYIVFDKDGNSIVIEPVDGKLNVYDNALGVLTNSPGFDWHLTNLRNFINLSPNNKPALKIEGVTLAPFGQGSGLVGMPGDFTPPSRFVRAAIFSTSAIPSDTAEEAIYQTFHILNQFDIPVGSARQVVNGVTHTDYTLATVARDPNSLKYYLKTYDDQNIKMVDLKDFDKNAKEAKTVGTDGRQKSSNISKELKPLKHN
jgi:choloylglycine hydrolase